MSENGKRLGYLLIVAVLVWVGFAMWPGEVGSGILESNESSIVASSEVADSSGDLPKEEPLSDARIPLAADGGSGLDGAFFGRVIDPDGEPISGAVVSFYGPGQREPENLLTTVLTSSEGKFRHKVPLDAPEPVQLVIRAEGFSGMSTNSMKSRERVITLRWLAALFGRVYDAKTGEGIADAIVAVGSKSVTTGSDGEYSLEEVRTGSSSRVVVRKTGYADKETSVLIPRPEGMKLDIALEQGAELTVLVFDAATENPMPGVRVFGQVFVMHTYAGAFRKPIGVTDENGRFTVRVLPGTKLELTLLTEGYSPFTWSWGVGFIRDLSPRIPMLAEARIEGRVQDAQGNPVARAQIHARNKKHIMGMWQLDSGESEALDLPGQAAYHDEYLSFEKGLATDDDGLFRVGVVAGDEAYKVSPSHRDFMPVEPRTIQGLSADQPTWLEFTLHRGATIRGHAKLNGKPWTDSVYWQAGNLLGRGDAEEDGAFELENVPLGSISLQVRDPLNNTLRYESKLQVTDAGEYEHDIAWKEEFSTISGTVHSSSGKPLPEVHVQAEHKTEGRLHKFRSKTAEDGSFTIEVIPGIKYSVGVMRKDRPPAVVDVSPNSQKVNLILPEMRSLRLNLIDAESKQRVESGSSRPWWISWKTSNSGRYQSAGTIIDPEGLARIELPVGSIDLAISCTQEGYIRRVIQGVQVDQHTEVSTLTVELERGQELSIHLKGEGDLAKMQRSHLLILLEESMGGAVRSADPERNLPVTMTINGISVWCEDPGLINHRIDHQEALLHGLKRGRYRIVSVPEDLVFDPEVIEIPSSESPVVIRWRKR